MALPKFTALLPDVRTTKTKKLKIASETHLVDANQIDISIRIESSRAYMNKLPLALPAVLGMMASPKPIASYQIEDVISIGHS